MITDLGPAKVQNAAYLRKKLTRMMSKYTWEKISGIDLPAEEGEL